MTAQEDKEKTRSEKSVSRRRFLKGTVVGGVGAAAAALVAQELRFSQIPKAEVKPVTTTVVQPVTTTEVKPEVAKLAFSKKIMVTVNGVKYEREVENRTNLLEFLRENLQLTGTKRGCDRGECGFCTVTVDGKPQLSCITMVADVNRKSIGTVEGLEDPITHQLSAIQQAFLDNNAGQCAMCIPGFLMHTKVMLDENPRMTEAEIREELAGNICRCSTHYRILDAVLSLVGRRA